MNIKIKELHLRNFKGAKQRSIVFDERLTNITGDNETGKTTIFDAFNWLLFGKNSENKSEFSIKTLDSENNPIPRLEHEVTGVFYIDDQYYTFKRLYKENWTKKRGSSVEVFDGHSESLFINDVPKKTNEYNSFVDSLFKTSISRMITNPNYFNEELKWEQRRAILMEMAGEVTEQSILDQHPELDLITSIFQEGKTVDDKKKELSAKKSRIEKEKESIPARLDEVDRSFVKDLRPIEVLQSTKKSLESKIDEYTSSINNKSAAVSNRNAKIASLTEQKGKLELKVQQERNRLSSENSAESNRVASRKQTVEFQIQTKTNSIHIKNESSADFNVKITELRLENSGLKTKYEELLKQEFDSSSCKCPACKQDLPESEIEGQKTVFNNFKSAELERLKQLAISNNEKIEKFKLSIDQNDQESEGLNNEIELLNKELEEINQYSAPSVSDNQLIIDALAKIEEINAQIEAVPEAEKDESKEEVRTSKKQAEEQLEAVKAELLKHETNSGVESRKRELMDQNSKLVEELGEIEAFEWQIQQFVKLHIEAIEASVNAIFNGVRFKMFEQQINGGEKATCICLVDGVPYPDVNTAGQINAGLRIIQALQSHFGMVQPVWIDNRERVSEIVPMDCQIINLKVVTGQKELQIN